MTIAKTYLKGLGYSLGTVRAIEELAASGVLTAKVLESLKQRGLEYYCEDQLGIADMAMSSVAQTLKAASLSPSGIDAVVFANSGADWTETEEIALYKALHRTGFGTIRVVGLMLQGCSACGGALQTACNLIAQGDGIGTVLVILCGRVRTVAGRLPPTATTIYSDGAASCIVSSEKGAFEILANESLTNTYLASAFDAETKKVGKLLHVSFSELSNVTRHLLDKCKLSPADVSLLLGTNGSQMFLSWMAAAADVAVERAYTADVARFAHVHSCDNLISLKNAAAARILTPGDHVLMLSWSPFVLSGSILRHCGPSV